MVVVVISGEALPEVWEESIVAVWEHGRIVKTEYGQLSKDITAVLEIRKPFKEPRIHLKGCICGLKGLSDYVREILEGTQDWRVGRDWHYTYHERLFSYIPVFKQDPLEAERLLNFEKIDQIRYIVGKLRKAPYSRRAVAVTWQPWKDEKTDYPPCLLYLWCRVFDGSLEMHVHMRSNDALKASFMNIYAYTELQKYIARQIGVEVGRYIHIADSYHIYEKDWKWAEKFVEQIKNRSSKKYWINSSVLARFTS